MRRVWLTALGGWFLTLAVLPPVSPCADEPKAEEPPKASSPSQVLKADPTRAALLIAEQTNRFRAEHRLVPVAEAARLTAAAEHFAQYMASTTKYGHRADGRQPADRAAEQGYEHCLILENLARRFRQGGFATEDLARGFVEDWKASKSHREAMLDPDVCEMGVAVVQSPVDGYYYAVQMLGRPKRMTIEFQVLNRGRQAVRYTVSAAESSETFTVPPRATATHVRCRNTKVEFPAWKQAAQLTPLEDGHYRIEIGPSGTIGLQRNEGPLINAPQQTER